MSKTFTDLEEDLLGSLENAYMEDPSPKSGRTYFNTKEGYRWDHWEGK